MLWPEAFVEGRVKFLDGIYNITVACKDYENFIQRREYVAARAFMACCQLPAITHQPAEYVPLHFQTIAVPAESVRQDSPDGCCRG